MLGITMFSVAFYMLTAILLNVTRLRVVAPFKGVFPEFTISQKEIQKIKIKRKQGTKFFAKKKLFFLRH